MSVTSLPLRTARSDALLWGPCFAAVVTAHIAIATLFLPRPSPDDDFGVDAPVVMLELPESFVVSTAPLTDLPPGPPQEETEATPPPKEETKPLEPQADIALPEPQPPKPEPPQEQKQATAPLAAAPSSAVIRRWETELMAHIERFRIYPPKALARGDQGLVKVSITIDRNGRVRETHILQSSGSPDLDQEALAALTRAQPMPRPPPDRAGNDLVIIPLRFKVSH
jgi:periplasmic protein TonB